MEDHVADPGWGRHLIEIGPRHLVGRGKNTVPSLNIKVGSCTALLHYDILIIINETLLQLYLYLHGRRFVLAECNIILKPEGYFNISKTPMKTQGSWQVYSNGPETAGPVGVVI